MGAMRFRCSRRSGARHSESAPGPRIGSNTPRTNSTSCTSSPRLMSEVEGDQRIGGHDEHHRPRVADQVLDQRLIGPGTASDISPGNHMVA